MTPNRHERRRERKFRKRLVQITRPNAKFLTLRQLASMEPQAAADLARLFAESGITEHEALIYQDAGAFHAAFPPEVD
tara:strand:+ start:2144 stop:2377 length:234 start_codon:yes stop_codon:yes gene_type:complete